MYNQSLIAYRISHIIVLVLIKLFKERAKLLGITNINKDIIKAFEDIITQISHLDVYGLIFYLAAQFELATKDTYGVIEYGYYQTSDTQRVLANICDYLKNRLIKYLEKLP
jgi:hypothetical protein